jgi:hypothetical protein
VLQQGQTRRLALFQHRKRRAGSLQQSIGIAQPALFLFGFLPFGAVEGKCDKLPHLPFQQFAFANRCLDILLGRRARLACGTPCTVCNGDIGCQRLRPGVSIEQVALGIATQQRMMGVLAMDVGEQIGDFAQLSQRRRGTVDIAPGTAGTVDHSAQQARLRVEVVRPQPGFQRPIRRNVELGGNLGTLGSGAYHRGIGTLAQRQRQRVDKDRLAGTGLTRKRAKTDAELEFEAVDNDEIPDNQTQQHVSMNDQWRGAELQCSFSLSMAK